MTIKELMTGKTPSADFEGWVTNDDMVLAVDISGTAGIKIDDFVVAQMGVAGLDAQMNPITQDKWRGCCGFTAVDRIHPSRPSISVAAAGHRPTALSRTPHTYTLLFGLSTTWTCSRSGCTGGSSEPCLAACMNRCR